MLSLHGVSVWIEVDGRKLEQHGVEEDLARNQVTCWIATQANKSFSVLFRDNMICRQDSLCSYLELDGSSIKGMVMRPSMNNRTSVQKGQALSATSERPFMFSKLELTDDDEYLSQSSTRLGELRISIFRVEAMELRLLHGSSSASSHGKIHERSKKAVTHCVSYGQEVKTAAQYGCQVRHLDDNPLATFIFKYRDLGLLQAHGIIPKPLPAKRKAAALEEIIDLTADDDDFYIKREPMKDEIEIVGETTQKKFLPSKRSNPSSDSGSQRTTKKIKRAKMFVPAGKVIDLT